MTFVSTIMNLGGPDLLIILVLVLVLFGAKKLPELARGMGQAVKEFQKAKDEFNDELNKAGKTETPATQPPPSTVAHTTPAPAPAPASPVTHPDANQTTPPGTQAGQV